MAIVKMKRLRLLTARKDRERIIRLLANIGAVEVTETVAEDGAIRSAGSEDADKLLESLAEINSAIDIAKCYSKFKSGLFSLRMEITESELFSSELMLRALDTASYMISLNAERSSLNAERSRLNAQKETYTPWQNLSVPLDAPSGRNFKTMLLNVPAAVGLEDVKERIRTVSECAELFEISADKELRYIFLVVHRDDEEKVFASVKTCGGSRVNFRGVNATAKAKIQETEEKIEKIQERLKALEEKLHLPKDKYNELLAAQDAITNYLECADAIGLGVNTENAFYIEGWCPAREEKKLAEFFEVNGCAYEFSEPEEGEVPPTLTYNSKIIAPFSTVTNMYSPPAYSGIDPNPMMAPFFAMFFGIMLSDAGYGLLLILAGIFALRKLKPQGTFKNFMKLAVICGVTTVVWGALFGGFFADGIPAIYTLFTGKTFPYDLALWFNPTEDPMTMLIFSLILGGIQIITSMAIKAYMMIRDGEIWAAIFDIGFWWVAFGGAITCIFNVKIGLYVLGAGVLGLVLTQGRAKKNIIMKFFGGIMSLYDVTGYFSDILSYSRLLALSLSTAVVGQVINTMGLLMNPVGFFIVFIIGHVFNIAINLVGSFVHSARLQYVEFFGRFYESGGRLFAPLTIKTKNTDIIKEEN